MDIFGYFNAWIHRKASEMFSSNASGNTVVRVREKQFSKLAYPVIFEDLAGATTYDEIRNEFNEDGTIESIELCFQGVVGKTILIEYNDDNTYRIFLQPAKLLQRGTADFILQRNTTDNILMRL